MKTSWIRILQASPNDRGDLFGLLMADLFIALGYEFPRINIQKAGREIDLSANHRLEQRRAIAECKATAARSGGDALNKFHGVLDAEYDPKAPISAYFISISGFTESAIEQEIQRKDPRTKVNLLSGEQIIHQLIQGRIIISTDRAAELAGRFCTGLDDLQLDDHSELLAHDRGWIWVIYYSKGKFRTSFALIHSDGTPLASSLADQIIESDNTCGGSLNKLLCLNKTDSPAIDSSLEKSALNAYNKYLLEECGYIQFDGMPADGEVGTRRLRLESLFVPLHLRFASETLDRCSLGEALSKHSKLALLASPGGGKSTLIKRIAVAYADPARRLQITDSLPDRKWIPLFFRCRELRGSARSSFRELLEVLAQRELVRQHGKTFISLVDRALSEGRVILLVDGLDEIPDPGDRAAFVCTLRTALQAYPKTSIIITSREAGFRHVACHLSPICTTALLAPFGADDIRRLTVDWNREIAGDTEKSRIDSNHLADTIIKSDRIRRLATNPLLLTTLLLVRRWVGSLPTRRVILYGKAVELLLMTWNTEGHAPIPEEEALPQLCYIAAAMMTAKIERISRPQLTRLLREARLSLPAELGYVKASVEEFIHRVEDRSSLLMMTGQDTEDGRLVEFYEFRHLTFQEYLAGRGMVEGWHPGREDGDTLSSVMDSRLCEEKWREVIPLAASLGGKSTEQLINRIVEKLVSQDRAVIDESQKSSLIHVLGSCLADEVVVTPNTIRAALRAYVSLHRFYSSDISFFISIAQGKYGAEIRSEAGIEFFEKVDGVSAKNLGRVVLSREFTAAEAAGNRIEDNLIVLLRRSSSLERCEGALALAEHAEYQCVNCDAGTLTTTLAPLIYSDDSRQQFASCTLFCALASDEKWRLPYDPDFLGRMFELWRDNYLTDLRSILSRAICSSMILDYDKESRPGKTIKPRDVNKIFSDHGKIISIEDQLTCLLLSYYTSSIPLSQLIKRASLLKDQTGGDARLEELLRRLLNHLAII